MQSKRRRRPDVENDQKVEAGWAIKAAMHAESYYKQIAAAAEPWLVRLTNDFRREFPKFDVHVLNEDEMKSPEGKDKWRTFLMHYESAIDDFNFGSLVRRDASLPYSPENAILVPRAQFLAIELARNREHVNKPGSGELVDTGPQTIRLPRRDTKDEDSDGRDDDLEREVKTPAIRLQNAVQLKQQGTSLFQQGKIEKAERRYRKAWKEINDMDYLTDAQTAQLRELQSSINANRALCCIKLENYHGAVQACDLVLEVDKANVKALYRRGLAHLKLALYDKAQEDLTAACRIDPANADIRSALDQLKRDKAELRDREKQMFGKLFRPSPAVSAPAQAQAPPATSVSAQEPATELSAPPNPTQEAQQS